MLRYRFAALALLLISSSDGMADVYTSRPTTTAIRQATADCTLGTAPKATGIIGISDPHAVNPKVIALVKETGVRWVRAEIIWSDVQPTPSSKYDWSKYDAMINGYHQAGINVLAILTYIPRTMPGDWAQIDAQFQGFATAAVKRFAPKGVHYWEIFNEPNLPGYGWLVKGLNARDFLGAYTLLLARANKAVRDNDPLGTVVLGGLASDNPGGIPAEDTMKFIYDAGARYCFDVFAFHPYGYQNNFQAARARVDAMMSAGQDTGKPVWFNEYGWTDYSKMDMNIFKSVDNNPMMAVFKQRNQADALFWFSVKDYSSKWGTPAFGLADFYFRKRKSFWTFKYLVNQAE